MSAGPASSRKAPDMSRHFSLRPMNVGVEIYDITGDPSDPAVRDELSATWIEHGLVKLANVDSIDMHIAISRAFGDLAVHPMASMRARENELFMPIGSDSGMPYVFDEREVKIGTLPWHRDLAYTPKVAKGAVLRMVEAPARGGETWFADTARAYDDLPAHLRARLDDLEWVGHLKSTPIRQSGPGVLWETVRPLDDQEWARTGLDRTEREPRGTNEPPVVHPAAITHPESGRRCIFLSPKEFDFFLGLDRGDSDALFSEVCGHMLQDTYVYKQRWRVDDVMGWDNRRFMHAATGSYVGDGRRGLRTTLAGDFSAGRFYEPTGS